MISNPTTPGTAHISGSHILAILSALHGSNNKTEKQELCAILDDLKELLKKKEVSFKKRRLTDARTEPIDEVHIAITHNSVKSGAVCASTGTPAELIEAWLDQYQNDHSGALSLDNYLELAGAKSLLPRKWRVVTSALGSQVAHVFFSNSDAEDYVAPSDPVEKVCVIEDETYCNEDEDEEDDCELVKSACLKNFKLSC